MPNPAYGTSKESDPMPRGEGFDDLFDELADKLEKENTLRFRFKDFISNLWRRIVWITDFKMHSNKKILGQLNDLRDQLNTEKKNLDEMPNQIALDSNGKVIFDNSMENISYESDRNAMKSCIKHTEIQIRVLEWVLKLKPSIDIYPSEIGIDMNMDIPHVG